MFNASLYSSGFIVYLSDMGVLYDWQWTLRSPLILNLNHWQSNKPLKWLGLKPNYLSAAAGSFIWYGIGIGNVTRS